MNSILSISIQRLLWKDTRLILPLFWMLFGLAIAFHIYVIYIVDEEQTAEYTGAMLLIGTPFMFAFGTGPSLISHEKERGLLSWLKSMPIQPNDIIVSKLLVAVVSTTVICLLTLLLNGWLRTERSLSDVYTPILDSTFRSLKIGDTPFEVSLRLILLSALITLTSLFLAWRFNHVLVGLSFALPLAFAMSIVWFIPEAIIDFLMRSIVGTGFEFLEKSVAPSLFSIALIGWLGWRSGNSYLRSGESVEAKGDWWRRKLLQDTPPDISSRSVWTLNSSPYSPTSALIWQFAKQNQWLVGSTLVIFSMLPIAAKVVFAIREQLEQSSLPHSSGREYTVLQAETIIVGSCVAVWLACCWLGVITFQSDSKDRRRGFFAERGISKTSVWWTRHIVPMSCIAFGVVVLTLMSSAFDFPTRLVFFGSAFYLGILYALSQWCSILIRQPVVAYVASPVIAIGLLAGFLGAAYGDELHFWIAGFWILIPLLASYIATRAWMDSKQGVVYWIVQVVLMGLLIATPGLGVFRLLTLQNASQRQVTVWRTEANQLLQQQGSQPIKIPSFREYLRDREREHQAVLARNNPAESAEAPSNDRNMSPVSRQIESAAEFQEFVAHVQNQIEVKLQANSSGPPPIYRPDPQIFKLLIAEATVDRMGEDRESYRKKVQLIDRLASNSRQARLLSFQDRCDVWDLWLLRECRRNEARELLGDDLYTSIVIRISDEESRTAARREAVLVSWSNAESEARNKKRWAWSWRMGDYEISSLQKFGLTEMLFYETTFKRTINSIARELLACLDERKEAALSNEVRLQILRRIEDIWNEPGHSYFIDPERTVPYADAIEDFDFTRRTEPCGLWFGKWEKEALLLRKALNETGISTSPKTSFDPSRRRDFRTDRLSRSSLVADTVNVERQATIVSLDRNEMYDEKK